MDQEEENKYVSQLQDVFNSCDTTGTGYLDKDELTDLCHKLHMNAQLPLLLQTLLGNDLCARVNFEEFKEGFVAILSSTLDITISDDDESSYLEPVIPGEVKSVKETRKYVSRTQSEHESSANMTNKYFQEQHHNKKRRKSQLRRSSSLESVESLKSDEEAEIPKEPQIENFEAQGQLRSWNQGIFDRPTSAHTDMTENQVRDIWEELGVGQNGYLNKQELATVCKNIGLEDLSKEELEDLFKKLDRDGDGRVSFHEFKMGLFSHAALPIASTPKRQTRFWAFYQQAEESSHKTATTSLLSGYGGFHLFSSIDNGTGFGNPEQIMMIWEEEGIEDCRDILMGLDFNLEEQVNLLDLTTALDNELIATKNRIHLATLASYKHELHYQHNQIEQVTKERDKVKQDLERSEKRNLQLADEVDDHNSLMESLNESKIKDLELEYKQRVSTIRTEMESEKNQFLQHNDQEKKKMEADLAKCQIEEAFLRDKLNLSLKENSRLQKEMVEVVAKLSESESQVLKLQTSIDHILIEKKHSGSPSTDLFTQEDRFVEIIREYEVQCRELRDRNDELQIQLETLRSQLSESKYSRLLAKMKDNKLLHYKAKEKIHHNHVNADAPTKKGLSSRLRRSVSAAGSNNGSPKAPPETSPLTVEAELTKHHVQELQQEVQDLKIQLETKVNFYERDIELMKTNFEKERKDTEHSFKMEISELEEQKAGLEEISAKYQEVIDGLKEQLSKCSHFQEMEKKFEKERAGMEEYYAKEISALAQRLSREKEQLEEEMTRTHQHEMQSLREEADEELAEKVAQLEAQYADYLQTLSQQHLNEKNKLLQQHELDQKALLENHICEMKQWEERENVLMTQWKKDELKLVEKQNEEQVHICKTFALEREKIENHYSDQINRLNQEITGLNALLMEARNSYLFSRRERPCDHCLEENASGLSDNTLGALNENAGEVVYATQKHEVNTPTMNYTDNMLQNEKPIGRCNKETVQYEPVSFLAEVGDRTLSLLKHESALMRLQEMEGLVSSLRAQLRDDTKAQEILGKWQKGFEGRAHLSNEMTIREDEVLLCLANEHARNTESMFQLLGRKEEEVEGQVVEIVGCVHHENKVNITMGKRLDTTARQDSSTVQHISQLLSENVTVEDLAADNNLLCQELRNKDVELSALQRQIREAMSQSEEVQTLASKEVHEAREELEKEKNTIKDRLFELEELVRRLEKETTTSQDDRMELSRLSEDNAFLRNKVQQVQEEAVNVENANKKHRLQVDELKTEIEEMHCKLKELHKKNQELQNEMPILGARNQEAIDQLNTKLEELTKQKEDARTSLESLQETLNSLEAEKRQQLSEFQKEKEKLNWELQISKQENEKYWDELCRLNEQSLQLTSTVSDLSAQREGSYETIQEMNARLREVMDIKHEAVAHAEHLQGKLNVLERENHENQAGWQKDREQLESELQISKQENTKTLKELWQLNCTLSDLKAQNEGGQETMAQLSNQLKKVTHAKEEAAAAMETLQGLLTAMEREKAQLQSDWQKDREQLEQKIQVSNDKLHDLILKHKQEKQHLLNGLDETNKQLLVTMALQEEVSTLRQEKQSMEAQCQSVTEQLKEAIEQVIEIEQLRCDLGLAQEECRCLKRSQDQCKAELDESQDQLLEVNTKLTIAQSQHMREVQQLKEKLTSAVSAEQLSHLQNRLSEEQQKVQQLQERLRFHAEQTNRQLAMQQEEHERLLRRMEERMQDVEMNLKNVRVMLQEKVDQLREQLEKNAKADLLLKDLYVENAQLMKALQVTEQRQKSAEKKNYLLEEKIAALNKVVRKIAPASMAV